MPTEELKRALERQKVGDAEADDVEVVARVLQLAPALVYRVLYAFQSLDEVLKQSGLSPCFSATMSEEAWLQKLPNAELRKAIRRAVALGATRLRLARAIVEGAEVKVDVQSLLPAERAVELCRGCPEQLECLASSLSTPEACFTGRKKALSLKPLRLTGVAVEAEAQQPAGRHVIPLSRIKLCRERKS